jgi:hypothetical protein
MDAAWRRYTWVTATSNVTCKIYARFSPSYLKDAAAALEFDDLGSMNQRTLPKADDQPLISLKNMLGATASSLKARITASAAIANTNTYSPTDRSLRYRTLAKFVQRPEFSCPSCDCALW